MIHAEPRDLVPWVWYTGKTVGTVAIGGERFMPGLVVMAGRLIMLRAIG